MNCELCGTPVKVVGDTTKHYEPLEMPEMISELIYQRSIAFDEARDARGKLKDAIECLEGVKNNIGFGGRENMQVALNKVITLLASLRSGEDK